MSYRLNFTGLEVERAVNNSVGDFTVETITELKAITSSSKNKRAWVKDDGDTFEHGYWWNNTTPTPDVQPDDFVTYGSVGGWMRGAV